MQGFHIWSITKYEIKTLLRSWFFRIFGVLAIIVLFFQNLITQTDVGRSMNWDLAAIPAGIPYSSLLILNVAQAVIAAFLASDFLRRDRKLDSTEVIYMRSMSNGDYVLGKTLGNLIVFLGLNFLVLLMVAIFNLISKTSAIDAMAYFQYLIFMSLPTLIFIMGLSFFLMSFIRNQGITFILILGYVALSLFYLNDKVNHLFDYMALGLPMMKSDMVGFAKIQDMLLQRGIYLFLGIGFICWTIVLLKRLPQSRFANKVSVILAGAFVSAGLFSAFIYSSNFFSVQSRKDAMIALNNTYAGGAMASVSRHDIKLEHTGNSYKAESRMMLINNSGSTIPAIILSLNPGLEIKSLSLGGANTAFKREEQIINIAQSLASGDSVECSLAYEGKIDEAYCYLELDAETMEERSSGYQNSFSFVEPEYVLLTPETNWYPLSGVSYSSSNPQWMHPDFTRFSLEINDPSPLKAISQGTESSNGSAVVFRTDHPMPFISLAMGKYQKLIGTADSIEFQLAFHPGHDYFKDAFPDVKDTIVSIISSRLQDYERRTNLNYPYKRFMVVEVPIQFTSFQHVWAGGFENVQPEIIFLPEKGAGIREANILGNLKNYKRMEGRGEETISEKDLQIRVLNNFCNLFLNDQSMPIGNFRRGKVTFTERINRYNMFPMLFSYSSFFTSAELPFFNRILESYLKNTFSEGRGTMMRQMSGTTGDEKANMVLQEKSFAQVLNDPGQTAIIDNVIALKADVLFSAIKARSGKEEFEKFLYAYIDSNQYTVTTFKEFESEINSRFNIDLNAYITEWLNYKELPGFLFGPVVANKVRTDQMVKTMVQFKVSNLENVNGMIKIVFRFGGGGGGGRGSGGGGGGGMSFGGGDAGNTVEKFVTLSGNQTKTVSFLLDSEPRAMTISTLTSKNIPMEIINTFRRIEPNRSKIPFEGEVIENDVVNLVQPGEIVMDNEDPGFEIIQPENKGAFVRLLGNNDENADKYAPLVTFRIPENWKLTTNSFFYGKYVRSAYYVRKGEGDRKARWNIPIQSEGYYNVYFYLDLQLLQQNRMAIFARQNRGGGQGGADRGQQRDNEQKVEGQYQFIIHHDGGEETITINLADIEGGWNSLGSFFFNPEKAVIELTNKGEGQMMIADAVKLIKEQE